MRTGADAPGLAPPGQAALNWSVERWFNLAPGQSAPTLDALRGHVLLLHAFQMLCPGCVLHGLPQMQRVQQVFAGMDLRLLGLHTVFEHHEAMGPASLQAFLHEFRVGFPVGVDRAEPGHAAPRTMRDYALQGTPSLLLIDRQGDLRFHALGRVEDLQLGALIAQLLAQ
ncbi:peroxiredoxin family protein [Inhella sp.]|uniref:peroxiredoxin family protein n=1 Tax=Inhella sp. TaxID=1921806 RepID=UPI0035B03424